jgi:ESS family glutamate:Na+ symporter
LKSKDRDTHLDQHPDELAPFENPHQVRLITADNAITTLGMFAPVLHLLSL